MSQFKTQSEIAAEAAAAAAAAQRAADAKVAATAKPLLPAKVGPAPGVAPLVIKDTWDENAANAAIALKYRGEKFVLVDANSDGIPDKVIVVAVNWQAEEKAKADNAKYASYHQHIQLAKDAAGRANDGKSPNEVAAAVNVAVAEAKASWKGAVPPVTVADVIVKDASNKEAATKKAVRAELDKLNNSI